MNEAGETVRVALDQARGGEGPLLWALALGVAANFLLWDAELAGPGLTLWTALLALAALMLVRTAPAERRRVVAICSLVAVGVSLVLVLRATEIFVPFVLLAMLAMAATVLLHGKGIAFRETRVWDYLRTVFSLPKLVVGGAYGLLRRVSLPGLADGSRGAGILRGVILALPLLWLFGALFAEADATFSRLLPDLAVILSDDLPGRLILIVVVSWVCAGLLREVGEPEGLGTAGKPAQKPFLGAEETTVILGTLCVLFATFVLLQLSYLFGGRDMIESSTGLTVADYARRGFFELLAVAGLTFAVLLALGATSGTQRAFRPLAAVLVICVLIILASAVQRLLLYIASFDLSVDRVMALAVMAWLAFCFLLFAATVLRGTDRGLAAGMLAGAVALVVLTALGNPAAFVARNNIERALAARAPDAPASPFPPGSLGERWSQLDVNYLVNLGADAVPVLLANLDRLNTTEQCTVSRSLLVLWHPDNEWYARSDDWRNWNAATAAATAAVTARAAELETRVQEYYGRFGDGSC